MMVRNILIETERLIIRGFKTEDAADIYQAWSDRQVMEYFPVQPLETVADARREIERLISCYEENTPDRLVRLSQAVEEKERGKVIGWAGFTWLDFDHSVFGLLTDGDEVRDDIQNTPTDDNDKPLDDVVMTSVT